MTNKDNLPSKLPSNWTFPPPSVDTSAWTTQDWIRYAAPFNDFHKFQVGQAVMFESAGMEYYGEVEKDDTGEDFILVSVPGMGSFGVNRQQLEIVED